MGASIGLDRLLALLEEAGWAKGAATTVPVLIRILPGADPRNAVALAARLRAVGGGAEVYPDADPGGEAAPVRVEPGASARRDRGAVRAGGARTFNLRDLATREERKGLPWADLETEVARALGLDPRPDR